MAWLHAVYFLDQNHGWVAGTNGTLLATDDGGSTWRKLQSPASDAFRDVYFANEKTGWLLAQRDPLKLKTNDEPRSYLLKTEDGGVTWQRLFLSRGLDNPILARFLFLDPAHAWVFGETGIIFSTTDGGENWSRHVAPTKHLLLGGAFCDETHGWLVGAGAIVIQTGDGGQSWVTPAAHIDPGFRLNASTVIGSRLGWSVGSAGSVIATVDGGRTWFAQTSNVESDLFDVKFVDAANGWAAGGDGIILQTVDGGSHWVAVSSGTPHTLSRLFFADANHGWAVGFGGTILTLVATTSTQAR